MQNSKQKKRLGFIVLSGGRWRDGRKTSKKERERHIKNEESDADAGGSASFPAASGTTVCPHSSPPSS
jgi:hypothetical protein